MEKPLLQTALWQYRPVGITSREYEQMRQRLRGARHPSGALPTTAATAPCPEIILGIDPSLRGTGYGIIRWTKPHPQLLAHGTVRCPSEWPASRCLLNIAQAIRRLLEDHHPEVCVMEGLFYAQNQQTTLLLGQARGASLVAVAEAGINIFEMAPRKVKQAIVGYGAAQKVAVAKMVQRLLNVSVDLAPDAADALAVALAHAREFSRFSLAMPRKI